MIMLNDIVLYLYSIYMVFITENIYHRNWCMRLVRTSELGTSVDVRDLSVDGLSSQDKVMKNR